MTIVTNEDFALEVKGDRLKTLYQFTLIFCAIAGLLVFTFGFTVSRDNGLTGAILLSLGTLAVGCWVTRTLLQHQRVTEAAWAYSLGIIAGTSVLLIDGSLGLSQLVVFILPVIVFLAGLLMSPAHTFIIATISSIVAIVVPNLRHFETFTIEANNVFAIFLIYLAAVFAAQVSGELYQVTEWALSNYQRQRRTNDELFEKRQELQLSLKRSEILGEKLMESNQELESAYATAEEAKQFRGQFLANMSHELRTPLNAIIGFSETMLKFPMMYDNEPLPNMYERDLSQIFNSGRQLLHVINDILDLAKVDAGKLEIHMQKVEIGPIIGATSSTAKGLLKGRPIQLAEELPDPLPYVWADESRLRQVMLNLYSNACKYTDEGTITLIIKEKDDRVLFTVKDTGVGIAPEFQQAIFEEFKQATNNGRDVRSGTGLGLSISRQLLNLMEGELWLESEPGVGSEFTFSVALYKDQDKKEPEPVIPADEEETAIKDTKPMSGSKIAKALAEPTTSEELPATEVT